MAIDLKQSTTATVVVGPIVYATDGHTVWQSYDVTTMVCAIGKFGVAPAGLSLTASGGDNDLTDAASMPGWYELELQPTNVGTLGPMRVMFDNSDIVPWWEDFNVKTANVWDTLYSTDQFDVNVAAITASIITAAAIASDAIAAAKIAGGAIVAGTLASDTITADKIAGNAIANAKIADGALTAAKLASDTITADKIAANAIAAAKIASDAITADKIAANAIANAKIADDAITGAKIVSDVGAALSGIPWNASWDAEVESEVDDAIGAGGSDLTAIPWNASWDAEVQSEAQDALEANNLDHLLKIAVASITMADEVVTDSIMAKVLSSGDVAAFECTTDALQPLKDALATTASIADAVWDETLHASLTGRDIVGVLLPAFAAGKASGAGTTSITFRDIGDGFNAIVQTVDASGNRSAVDVTCTA